MAGEWFGQRIAAQFPSSLFEKGNSKKGVDKICQSLTFTTGTCLLPCENLNGIRHATRSV